MKKATFKKPFNGMNNALNLIPESYKIDGNEFEVTDGIESYRVRWDGSLTEGKGAILIASDKKMINEDMNKIKHLMNFSSKETLGNLKGSERIDEDKSFKDVWGKTKKILSESKEDRDAINEMDGGYGFTSENNFGDNKISEVEVTEMDMPGSNNLVGEMEPSSVSEEGAVAAAPAIAGASVSVSAIRGKLKTLLATFGKSKFEGKERTIVDQLLDIVVSLGAKGNDYEPRLQTKLDLFKKAVADAQGKGDEGDEGEAQMGEPVEANPGEAPMREGSINEGCEDDCKDDCKDKVTKSEIKAANKGDEQKEIAKSVLPTTGPNESIEETDRFDEIFEGMYESDIKSVKKKVLTENGEMWDIDASHRDSGYSDFDPSDLSMAGDNDMSDEEINNEGAKQLMNSAFQEMGIDNPLAKHTTFYSKGIDQVGHMLADGREEEAMQHAQAIASQIYNSITY
jgi:hypothetical protein